MINEVFYSLLIRAALMGLQIIFGGVVWYTIQSIWTMIILGREHTYPKGRVVKEFVGCIICAFLFSLCFFFIRFYGGY